MTPIASESSVSALNVAKDLYIPIILIWLTFVFTKLGEYWTNSRNLHKQRVAYIDIFLLQLNKINISFENLISEVDDKRYFPYKIINSITEAVNLLQRKLEDVIIFSDDNLRQKIIITIDQISTLNSDIKGLEDYYNAEDTKYKEKITRINNDLQNCRLTYFNNNIELDDNLSPVALDKLNTKKLNSARTLALKLINQQTQNQNDFSNTINFCKDKRTALVAKILDAQAKIRLLIPELNEKR